MLCYNYIVHVLLPFLISGSRCSIIHEENDYDELLTEENFNKTWIYMPNDKGDLYKAVIVDHFQDRMFRDVNHVLTYILYTRENPDGELLLDSDALKDSSFKFTQPTKIITHGWRSNGRTGACEHIRRAYLEQDDYNVIIMDWEPVSASITYIGSVYYLEAIGLDLATFVDDMICQGIRPEDIHMIGHSLGAHIMGEAGRQLAEERIHRITGLDPAAPLFESGFSRKLTRDAADFVDVIHTATGSIGYKNRLGTVDFYPNGGKQQPYCKKFLLPDIGCDHTASWKYFKASIENRFKYVAVKCPSFVQFQDGDCYNEKTFMGDAVSTNIEGKFFLEIK